MNEVNVANQMTHVDIMSLSFNDSDLMDDVMYAFSRSQCDCRDDCSGHCDCIRDNRC